MLSSSSLCRNWCCRWCRRRRKDLPQLISTLHKIDFRAVTGEG